MTLPRWVPAAATLGGVALLTAAITCFRRARTGPALLMGSIPRSDVIRFKRGLLCLVLALVCLFVGGWRVRVV